MPRIVPRTVIDLIDTAIDVAKRQQEQIERQENVAVFSLPAAEFSAALAGVIALVDQLPAEFLAGLTSEDFSALTVNVAAIRSQLRMWELAGHEMRGSPLHAVKGWRANSITIVRQMLSKCPNELPAVGPHGLDFIADDEFRGILLRDLGSTEEALANNEYKAATVLAASVIEALSLWALSEPARTALVDASKAGDKLLKSAKRWGCTATVPSGALEYGELGSYLDIVGEIGGVIAPDTLALANTARNFRNLIHPGRAQRTAAQCDRGTALATHGALLHVIRDLTPA
jgi:hypothetical protein